MLRLRNNQAYLYDYDGTSFTLLDSERCIDGRYSGKFKKGMYGSMSVFKRFDHVSIGVKDAEKARALFLDVLGGEELPDKGSSSEGFDWFTFNLGGKKMEVVSSTREAQA